MIRLNDILDKVSAYNPTADLNTIRKAYVYTALAHKGQVRLSGEPYLIHPLEVADIIADLKMDVASITAGLLHDTLEDTLTSVEELSARFGEEITTLVAGLTKISKISFKTSEEHQAENFRKMILAMVKDIRVLIIKLADRLHNMRTLEFQKPERQQHIAQETLDIYAPLANRLGIAWIKQELEDLSLRYLKPVIYAELEKKIAAKKEESREYIHKVITIIERNLHHHKIDGKVSGRLKHLYSIYQKMVHQNIGFDQIYDILAFRITVTSVRDCYAVLGIIHSLWVPVPGRFKDYIAMPKTNMYQSLHTTVIGPDGEHIEFQTRTEEMHRIAEMGIAAHWQYKEGYKLAEQERAQLDWLRQMIEWQGEVSSAGEFLESVKVDLFSDSVYVFTPQGEVIELAKGSTPVDFAYSIHSNIGDHCTGAKVSGKMVTLKYELKTGQVVEIITSKKQHPNKDWLHFVKTSKARTKIRHWIKKEEERRSIELGKELCEREFSRHKLSFSKELKQGNLQEIPAKFSLNTTDTLIAAVGRGKISALQLLYKLYPELRKKPQQEKKKETAGSSAKKKRRSSQGIVIKDIDDVLVRFAKCCNPLPGDRVIGFITRGRGVTIHRPDCKHVLKSDPERQIEVSWDLKQQATHRIKIRVLCEDRKGMLAELSAAISSEEANITDVRVTTNIDRHAVIVFETGVTDLKHLRKVIGSVEQVKGVIEVHRLN
ncbi:MAG: bifunctional (p)ppGpp synthetase/guanosine-3',5'-bis(diphosphate) 3'-pyrophosphohydrolase [Deltaproteobacteria bacterium]|nr:bifunctional (p)ppGpp synthetase/guanosine-3',5'-bis(diphosphate) 3'-pyrophosphohydrolase [Candidatus Anaeroferrophillus wilburensis]MBN2888137.1 bifunctional (p)ppGpp synthetase/guanosine-3',5'-bis(diphosphate) 3'-pyrophosphohydrolase [Deltaproteobacteria bacterium]